MHTQHHTPVHGWINLDKPQGMSSAKAVAKVKYLLKAKKAGHGGTLDPEATGVLPIALGEATKIMPLISDTVKAYRFTIRFGIATITDDAEGEVIETSDICPSPEAIKEALPYFTGEIQQVPPAYSALKINGKRSYALARQGEEVAHQPRAVHIHSLNALALPSSDAAELEVTCGKGTYVRSLARDISRHLGTCGHVVSLRRTRVGNFLDNDAISLAKLEELVHNAPSFAEVRRQVLPVAAALDDILVLPVSVDVSLRLKHGNTIALPRETLLNLATNTVCTEAEGKIIAICRLEKNTLKPVRVLNY